MSAHTKRHHISTKKINILVTIPGNAELCYSIPNTVNGKEKLEKVCKLLQQDRVAEKEVTRWQEATSWEKLAAERIAHYKETGLVLRGARYREGFSQKELAKRTGISQDNLSRMENGKRSIGEKVAKRLAKALHIDHRLLLVL